jgi:hypothetical protein
MSQINVNVVLPLTSNVVDVNGLKLKGNNSNSTVQIGGSSGLISAQDSVLMGYGAATSCTGQSTVAIGKFAGLNLTTGFTNVLIGSSAGQATSTGNANTSIGTNAGAQITTSSNNTCVGQQAGFSIITGNANTFIGAQTGMNTANIEGGFNTAIGYGASPSTNNVYNEITLGNSNITALRCAVTSITSLSDARDKKEVQDLNVGLEFIDGLRPVKFVWDDREENGKHDIADFGFIAQDLKAAEEAIEMADVLKLVYDENSEKLEASYGKLIPILVKAVQELSAEVKQLKNK